MFSTHLRAAVVALAVLGVHAAARAAEPADDLPIEWDGREADAAAIAEALGDEVARVVTHWALVAERQDAAVHLSKDGRVLLFTHSERSKLKKELALVAETLEAVDAIVPKRPEPSNRDAGEPHMQPPTDSETLVLLQAEDEEEYVVLLSEVVALEPYLADWATSARRLAGFTLTRPLAAAWIETLDGQEEWDIRNELVHRLAHIAIARRFGEIPYWLQMGLNWHIEEELLGAVYCFPYRAEFVWASEHTSWESDLKREFRRRDTPFFEDLAQWTRGRYQGAQARQAFGFARFLARHHDQLLPQVLSDLFHLRSCDGVVVHESGAWELIPGWEPSADAQRAIFERIVGHDVLHEVTEFFVDGKRYKKPRGDS